MARSRAVRVSRTVLAEWEETGVPYPRRIEFLQDGDKGILKLRGTPQFFGQYGPEDEIVLPLNTMRNLVLKAVKGFRG